MFKINSIKNNFMKPLFMLIVSFFILFTRHSEETETEKESRYQREVLACAATSTMSVTDLQGTIVSVKDGKWSDTATWGGILPTENDVVQVATNVILDIDSLPRRQNLIVTGKLTATKGIIKFLGINENNFVGGGEVVLPTDIGLWVIDGQLDFQGETKTSWLTATAGIVNTKTLPITPTNWKAGDEIMITPTEKNKSNFDVRVLASPTTTTVNTTSHSQINGKWNPEVANLTRNLRIEGTATGRSHVFIRSNKPQIIKYVGFRWLGPRKDINGDGRAEVVPGRYGIHFHHCYFGSTNSVVEGCIMRDLGNHAYVTHGSHFITIKDCVSFNTYEAPFWWDPGFEHSSHKILWDHDLAANVNYIQGAVKLEVSPDDITISSRGFELNHGDDDIVRNCVAVGTQGDDHDGGGFKWEAVENTHLEGVWKTENILAHNCNTGIISWQNTVMNHVIKNANTYNNGLGIFQGAYVNSYEYINGEDFGNPTVIHAGSVNTSRIRITNRTMDSVAVISSPVAGDAPILFRNCTMRRLDDWVGTEIHSVDIVNCNVPTVINHSTLAGEVVRVQPLTGQAYKLTAGNIRTNITNFAPSVWGNGTGLTGSYYTSTNFTNLAFRRLDSYIGFSEWGNGVHYKIGDAFSVRWTGSIIPYTTGAVTFVIDMGSAGGGSAKLIINGQQVASGNSGAQRSGTVTLQQGVPYSIQLDYVQTAARRGGVNLYWSNSLINTFTPPSGEYVPMSQLMPDATIPLPISPVINVPRPEGIKSLFVQTYTSGGYIKIAADQTYNYFITSIDGRRLGGGKITTGVNSIPLNEPSGMYVVLLMNVYGKTDVFKIHHN